MHNAFDWLGAHSSPLPQSRGVAGWGPAKCIRRHSLAWAPSAPCDVVSGRELEGDMAAPQSRAGGMRDEWESVGSNRADGADAARAAQSWARRTGAGTPSRRAAALAHP